MTYQLFNRTALYIGIEVALAVGLSTQAIAQTVPVNIVPVNIVPENIVHENTVPENTVPENDETETTAGSAISANIAETNLANQEYQTTDTGQLITTVSPIIVIAQPRSRSASTTATGLELTFRETPKTTTVITQSRIEDEQIDNVTELVEITSGINAQQLDGSRTMFSGRGFEIVDVEVDGMRVSYESQWGEGAEFSSMAIYERAEVVKGADGLMAGSGNPSATINLIRKQANSTDFSGEVSAQYDRYGSYGTTLDMGSRLTESGNIRGRLILDYTGGDTFIDREEKENRTAYGIINADVNDDTRVSIGAMHQDKILDEVMWGGLPGLYTDGTLIDWAPNQSTVADWSTREGNTDEVFGSLEYDINDDWHLEVNANHAQTDGDMKLFYPAGLVDKTTNVLTGSPVINYTWQTEVEDTNVVGEVSGYFDAFGRGHQAMIGADYNNKEILSYGQSGISNTRDAYNFLDGSYPEPTWLPEYVNDDYEIEEQSIYGSAHLQLQDGLGVVLGIRVTNYEMSGIRSIKSYDITYSNQWTPFIGATYDVTDNASVFASYTDIFQPQLQRDVDGNILDPIIGRNYEVGVKGSNHNNTLQAQFSVFRIEQDDLAQAVSGTFVTGSTLEQAYEMADGATSTGIDIEVTGQLTDNWQGSFGYTDFKIKDSSHDRINTSSPETTLKISTTYDAGNFIEGLTVGGGLNWMDDRYADFVNPLDNNNIVRIQEDSVTLVNLMARYEINDNIDVQVNVKNVLDETYINPIDFGAQVLNGEPLNVEGKITYRW